MCFLRGNNLFPSPRHVYSFSYRVTTFFGSRYVYFGRPCTQRACVCVCRKRRTRTAFKGHSTRHGRSSGRTMASRCGEERHRQIKKKEKKYKAKENVWRKRVEVAPYYVTLSLAVPTLTGSLSFLFFFGLSLVRALRFAIRDARRRRLRRLDRRTRSRAFYCQNNYLLP